MSSEDDLDSGLEDAAGTLSKDEYYQRISENLSRMKAVQKYSAQVLLNVM